MLFNHTTQGEWKVNLTMRINFFSSKHSEETLILHSNKHYTEVLIRDKTDEIIKELFESLLQKYLEGLEESKK